jgi:hypothetical protein
MKGKVKNIKETTNKCTRTEKSIERRAIDFCFFQLLKP